MNTIEKSSKRIKCNEYIASALLAVIPRIIMVLTTSFPLRVTGDELYMFYLPAKLAGLDWSGSMERYRYYGYGFTVFLVPLFKWISNPVILYRVVLCIVSILQMVITTLCCYLLKNFYKSYHAVTNTIISVICSYLVSCYATYMYNEHIYIIYVWSSFFIFHQLLRVESNKRRKLFYSAMLGLSFFGALTIHQRAVTLAFAFLITYVVYLVMFRRLLAYASIVMGIFGIGYFVNQQILSWNVAYLKSATVQVSEISNTSVNLSFSLSWFRNKEYVQAFIRTIIGNLNLLNLRTLGLWALLIVIVIYLLCRYFKGKITKDEEELGTIVCFGAVCIGITILGLATTWGWGIMQAYMDNNASADALRGLKYFRYYACYITPIFPACIIYMKKRKEICLKLFEYSLIGSSLCISYYMKRIVTPLMVKAKVGLVLNAFSFVTYETEVVSIKNYMAGIFIVGVIIAAMIAVYKYRTINGMLVIFMSVTIWTYIYNTYLGDGRAMLYNRDYSDASTQLIQKLNENEVACPIYVQDYSIPKSKQLALCQLQFMNMRNTLFHGMPSPDDEEAIGIAFYFSKEENDSLFENGYVLYQLDANEYAYVKGESILEQMEEYKVVEWFE